MLLNLHVKNLALIKELDVDFTKGMIVLTGETGAGKSLILGSVNIALGNKASKELIRTGTDYSLVEMIFSVSSQCAKKLKNLDIYMEDENTVTVTRKISEGRSVSKINGETVNVKILKKVMELLVDIHGQHDHQSLLYTNNHRIILDKFAKEDIDEIILKLKKEYSNYTNLKNNLASYDIDEGKRAREIEFAEYEINEIEAANLYSGEDAELEEDFKKLSNGKKIAETLSEIYNSMNYESNSGVGEIINRAVMEINQISGIDAKIDEMQSTLYDIDSMCRELVGSISDYTRELEFNPEKVFEIEKRLDLINHLKLKYGQTIEQILAYKDEKEMYLSKLNNYNSEIENINKKIYESERILDDLCDTLSCKRVAAAQRLEVLVKSALTDLNFLSVQFQIQITEKDKITENGRDNVEFLISTNPGEPLKPLAKVASGGELSRIMLAIKSILAEEDETDTLIFDEIDTGISGKTAQMVAEKLAGISKNHQVICISHLAQIAAMADSHYLIEKTSENNVTSTNIFLLDKEASIKEIVRISGGEMTDAAIVHAKEMKDMADRTKCNLF